MAEEPTVPRQRIHHRVKAHVVRRWEKTMESDRMTNALIFILVIAAGIGLIGMGLMATRPISSLSMRDRVSQLSAAATVSAAFACDAGKSIIAAFSNGEVRIALSDTREIFLPEVAAPTGAMYANPDRSFVFWNGGNEALIEEYGIRTYSNCTTRN